jgi:hypothetical protein
MDKKIIGVILLIVGVAVLVGSAFVLGAILTVNEQLAAYEASGLVTGVIQEGLAQAHAILIMGILWTALTIISGLLNILVGVQIIRKKL